MSLKLKLKNTLEKLGLYKNETTKKMHAYLESYNKYSFLDTKCEKPRQYEAVITRWYHTIEKGLSYENYRAGFGKDNIEKMLKLMEDYVSAGFDTSAFFYETALSCLDRYIKKNKEHGHVDEELNARVAKLPGKMNDAGGTLEIKKPDIEKIKKLNYEELLKERHSIRHFSNEPVDIKKLTEAVKLAQYTPSACNRQGWITRIVSDKKVLSEVLSCQNGNRGFGQEIDKLVLVTCDLMCFNKNREFFQAYIDGGLFSANLINALYYEGIGSIPLSASLSTAQEKKLRGILDIKDNEVLIIFIGVGNYPEECLTARSERKPEPDIRVI